MRPGEGRTGLLMFCNVLLILCAYYFIKPLREGWLAISDVSGLSKMELKAYSSFGQSLLLVGVVGFYSRLVGRWPRQVLVTRSTLFFMSNLVLFWLLQPGFLFGNVPGMGIVFYLWVGIFNVFVVAQFWAFAADLYTDERGRRLLPMIAIGATSGAVVGSWIAERLVASPVLGTENLLLAALVPLAASIWLTRASAAAEQSRRAVQSPPPPSGKGALDLVFHDRYLLAAAAITLLLSWVNTNGENLLFRVIQETLAQQGGALDLVAGSEAQLRFVRDGTTAFYGNFFFWVNVVALLLQSLVASRLLKYGGFAAIVLLLPVIALASSSVMALFPILAMIKVMKIAENATDYSINNTARHVLWLPLSEEVTYKAKPTIDTLFVRAGDGFAALTVMVGVHALSLSVQSFFIFNCALVLVWIAAALLLVRQHRLLTAEEAVPQPS